jgi:extracellular factor (EF) 3-hydroxypalmitic acid methyl ester biosynthesis protein
MNISTQNGVKKRPPTMNSEAADLVNREFKDGLVLCRSTSGASLRGKIIKLGRLAVSFEIYETEIGLRLSEVLSEFKIFLDNRETYSGRAVLSNILQTGVLTICEVKLDEPGVYIGINMPFNGNVSFLDAYEKCIGRWQNQFKLLPEFKLAVLDIQTYLTEVKLLLEQIEISITTHPSRSRTELEQQIFKDLGGTVLGSIDAIHERFEDVAGRVPPELRVHYQAFVHRQLHPLFLCSPFGHRTFFKPLGYAGDYEIMNMIHRNTFEGGSLYARLVHYWLVNQWASKSVRNRVAHMKTRLIEETARALREGRRARILNIGCGPAREVQDFVTEHPLSDHAEFTLLDFDAETLAHVTARLRELKRQNQRSTEVKTIQASVMQIIKDSCSTTRGFLGGEFDMIYCGGLFDYLSDKVCKQLVSLFYDCLAPGGLTVVANMNNQDRPFHQMVEYLLDWHLIYRNSQDMRTFVPENAVDGYWSVIVEPVTVNYFLEIRKPQKNAP